LPDTKVSLTEHIKEKAYELGFDLIGIAPAARAPHADAYASWVDAGYAATMGYLTRDVARRQDPRHALSGARSVVVVGLSYFVANPPADLWNDPSRGRIARYAWGLDYHDVLVPRLHQLADFILRETRRQVEHRVYVDTGPVLERDFAAQAGLARSWSTWSWTTTNRRPTRGRESRSIPPGGLAPVVPAPVA
jgi:epoxyqueuosine reductase